MPVLNLLRRSDPASTAGALNPTYIAGICVACVIALGLAIWLGIRVQRKRAAAKREDGRGAAFLSIRGLVKEDDVEKDNSAGGVRTFARDLNSASVVFPDKALPKSRADILDFHRQSGIFPQPFAPKPFSFALSAGSGAPPGLSPHSGGDRQSWRQSFMSGATAVSRFSVMSTVSSVDSYNPTAGSGRKVRQLFDPVLPDELLICRVGERLNVVQSFNDGWCLVGREAGTFMSTAKSLFKPNVAAESDVELGVVPAWCFLKPVPGMRVERPVRSSSLGITVQMNKPGFSSRDEITSWSNF